MTDYGYLVKRWGRGRTQYLGWDERFVDLAEAIHYPHYSLAKEVSDFLQRSDTKGWTYDIQVVCQRRVI